VTEFVIPRDIRSADAGITWLPLLMAYDRIICPVWASACVVSVLVRL